MQYEIVNRYFDYYRFTMVKLCTIQLQGQPIKPNKYNILD